MRLLLSGADYNQALGHLARILYPCVGLSTRVSQLDTEQKNDITGKLITGSLKALGKLPLPASHAIGNIAGRAMWTLGSDAKRVTQINIDTCFPDKSEKWRKDLAHQSVIETAKTACEMGRIWTSDIESTLQKVSNVEGDDQIHTALKDGKGVIVLAPHLGNWEMLGNYLGKNFTITNMYSPPDNPALDKLIFDARSKSGAKLAPTNRRGVIQIVRALRKGEMTGILPDQEPDRGAGGEYVPFFGKDALTATIVPKLLKESNAIAVGGFCLRKGNSYEIYFRPVDEGIYSEDLIEATAAMNKSVENYILECPEQYQWEYKRFKRRPSGEEKLYNPGRIAQ